MSRTFTSLLYHLVFSTKHRRPTIAVPVRGRLHEYLGGTVRGLGGTALEVGGTADHAHLLVGLHPSQSISEFIRGLKSNSSKWMNETRLLRQRFQWQLGYGAFTVSRSHLSQVRAYIQNQEQQHLRMSFEEEFLKLLNAHEIEYDPGHVFE